MSNAFSVIIRGAADAGVPGGSGGQWRVFSICLGFGALIGAAYDIIYIVRRLTRAGFAVTFIADAAFFAAAAPLIIYSARVSDYGEVHFYTVIAYAAGFIAERLTLGGTVAKSFDLVYNKKRKTNDADKRSGKTKTRTETSAKKGETNANVI